MKFIRPMRGRLFIALTLLAALMFDILPLPLWISWFRPLWTVLILGYWLLTFPYTLGVGLTFIFGIILDLLYGTTLGMHAFALTIFGYLIIKLHNIIRIYSPLQQTAIIFVLLFIYQLILFLELGILSHFPNKILYWMSIITSTLLWPWLFMLLQEWRRRLGYASQIM